MHYLLNALQHITMRLTASCSHQCCLSQQVMFLPNFVPCMQAFVIVLQDLVSLACSTITKAYMQGTRFAGSTVSGQCAILHRRKLLAVRQIKIPMVLPQSS